MKITDNLKNLMKGFKGRTRLTVETLAKELQRTENSIRANLNVTNYKPFFEKVVEYDNEKKKNVQYYSLSLKGQELLDNNFKLQEEENK